VLYAVLIAEGLKLIRVEFAAVVSSNRAQAQARLVLGEGFDAFDESQRLILGLDGLNPHVPAMIINDQQKIFVTAKTSRRDGSAEISINELQDALRTVCRGVRERSSVLLADDASLAELLHALDCWHALCHPLGTELV
jgi:hypothetical protein